MDPNDGGQSELDWLRKVLNEGEGQSASVGAPTQTAPTQGQGQGQGASFSINLPTLSGEAGGGIGAPQAKPPVEPVAPMELQPEVKPQDVPLLGGLAQMISPQDPTRAPIVGGLVKAISDITKPTDPTLTQNLPHVLPGLFDALNSNKDVVTKAQEVGGQALSGLTGAVGAATGALRDAPVIGGIYRAAWEAPMNVLNEAGTQAAGATIAAGEILGRGVTDIAGMYGAKGGLEGLTGEGSRVQEYFKMLDASSKKAAHGFDVAPSDYLSGAFEQASPFQQIFTSFVNPVNAIDIYPLGSLQKARGIARATGDVTLFKGLEIGGKTVIPQVTRDVETAPLLVRMLFDMPKVEREANGAVKLIGKEALDLKQSNWLQKLNPTRLTDNARAYEMLRRTLDNIDAILPEMNFTQTVDLADRFAYSAKTGTLAEDLFSKYPVLKAPDSMRAVILSGEFDAAGAAKRATQYRDALAAAMDGEKALPKDVPDMFKQALDSFKANPGLDREKTLDTVAKTYFRSEWGKHIAGSIRDALGIKDPGVIKRLFDGMKAWEGALYIGMNPGTLIRNYTNNKATLALYGINPLSDWKKIAETYKSLGFDPFKEIDQIAKSAVGKSAKAGAFGATLPKKLNELFPYFSKMEQADRQLAYWSGFDTGWRMNWKRGNWFNKMPASLERDLAAINPRLPNLIYGAIEAGLDKQTIYQSVNNLFQRIALQSFMEDPAFLQDLTQSLGANGNLTGDAARAILGANVRGFNEAIAKAMARRDVPLAQALDEELNALREQMVQHHATLRSQEPPNLREASQEAAALNDPQNYKAPTVTKGMAQRLQELGYSEADIAAMQPNEAVDILRNKTAKPPEPVTPTAPAAPAAPEPVTPTAPAAPQTMDELIAEQGRLIVRFFELQKMKGAKASQEIDDLTQKLVNLEQQKLQLQEEYAQRLASGEPPESVFAGFQNVKSNSREMQEILARAEELKQAAAGAVEPPPLPTEPTNVPPEGQLPTEPNVPAEQVAPELRQPKNDYLRRDINTMSPEDKDAVIQALRNDILVDKTGIGSARAYANADRRPIQVHSDVDGLKWINDNISHEAGDALLQAKADVLRELGIEAYHISGDEFISQFDTMDEAKAAMEKAAQLLKEKEIVVTTPDGVEHIYKGASFSYGAGHGDNAAEEALRLHKDYRASIGERSARGEKPRGLVETTPTEIRNVEGGNLAGAKPTTAEQGVNQPQGQIPEPPEANPNPIELPTNQLTDRQKAGIEYLKSLKNADGSPRFTPEQLSTWKPEFLDQVLSGQHPEFRDIGFKLPPNLELPYRMLETMGVPAGDIYGKMSRGEVMRELAARNAPIYLQESDAFKPTIEDLRAYASGRLNPTKGIGTISEKGAEYDSHLLSVLNNWRPYDTPAFTAEQLAKDPMRRMDAWNVLVDYVPRELRQYEPLTRGDFWDEARRAFRNLKAEEFQATQDITDLWAASVAKSKGWLNADGTPNLDEAYRNIFGAAEPGKGGGLQQGKGELGSTSFLPDGRAIVRAVTEGHNVSTAIHEVAHAFLPFLPADEMRVFEDFAGLKRGEFLDLHKQYVRGELKLSTKEGMRYRDAQEAWARGFERYLHEGNAPTPELKALFDRFAQFLRDIYGKILGEDSPIHVKLTDEMRGLYGRLMDAENYMTPEEMAKYKNEADVLANGREAIARDNAARKAEQARQQAEMQLAQSSAETPQRALEQPPVQEQVAPTPAVPNPQPEGQLGEQPVPAPEAQRAGAVSNVQEPVKVPAWQKTLDQVETEVKNKLSGYKTRIERDKVGMGGKKGASVEWFDARSKEVIARGWAHPNEVGTKEETVQAALNRLAKEQHARIIEEALKNGDNVPLRVLFDYPNLAEKYGIDISFYKGIADKYSDTSEQSLKQLAENVTTPEDQRAEAVRRVQERLGQATSETPVPPSETNALFQEQGDMPFHTGPNAADAAASEIQLLDSVIPLVKKYVLEAASDKPVVLDPLTAQALRHYIDAEIAPALQDARLAANTIGRWNMSRTVLNYDARTNFDEWASYVFPFLYWRRAQAANWVQRFMEKPALLAAYVKSQQALADQTNSPDYPARLRGKLKLPMPFMDKWMGGNIYFDPTEAFIPLKSIYGAEIDRAQYTGFGNSLLGIPASNEDIAKILRNKAARGEISRSDAENAIATRQGDLWNQAKQEATSDMASPDNLTALFTPHAPLQWAIAALTDNTDSIGPLLPISRPIRQLTGALGMNGGEGINIESPLRNVLRALGMTNLPEFDPFEEYRVRRMLANMVDDGIITDKEAIKAMMEKSGAIWAEAAKRANQERMAIPSLLTPTTVFPTGEQGIMQAQQQLRDLKAQVVRQLGGDPNNMTYTEMEDLLKRKGAYAKDGVIQKFYDAHPELNARSSVFQQPEERLKKWMVDEIWNKYNNAGALDKRAIRAQLGQMDAGFDQYFFNKDTRDYNKINLLDMIRAGQIIDAVIPNIPSGEIQALDLAKADARKKMQFAPPEMAQAYNDFSAKMQAMFDVNAMTQQGEEYKALTDTKAKQDYLQGHPEYNAYRTAWKKFYDDHPEISDWLAQVENPHQATLSSAPQSKAAQFYNAVVAAGLDWDTMKQKQAQYEKLPQGTGARTKYLQDNPDYKRYYDLRNAFFGNNETYNNYGKSGSTTSPWGTYNPSDYIHPIQPKKIYNHHEHLPNWGSVEMWRALAEARRRYYQRAQRQQQQSATPYKPSPRIG
jgi:GGDEF domain-containing protein